MNSRVLLLVSLLLLIGASVLGYLAYQSTADAKAEAEAALRKAESGADDGLTPMVVLARPVKAFQVLADTDLAVEKVRHPLPGSAQVPGAWVGRTLMTDLSAGVALNEAHFSPGGQVARLLRPGERAVAIPVNDVVGSGGFLQPGDMVDIVLFLEAEEGKRPAASTQVVMKTVRVLSFGSDLIDVSPEVATEEDKAQAETGSRLRGDAKSAVLAVAEADVSRLMLANSLGELRLAIVPAEELRLAAQIDKPVSAAAATTPANSSVMLPEVLALPVPSQKTAVPAQRHFLSESVLQLAGPRAVTSVGGGRPRVSVAQTPSVVIIRGLSSESK